MKRFTRLLVVALFWGLAFLASITPEVVESRWGFVLFWIVYLFLWWYVVVPALETLRPQR
jgi:hypothetical protein